MHLVDEQDGAPAGVGQLALGGRDDRADLLDPGVERGELDELPLGGQRDDVRERRLAGAGRAVEDQRHRLVGLDQPAQRRPRTEQVLLADDLVERARPHAHGQRRARVDRGAGRGRPRGRRTANVTVANATRGARQLPVAANATQEVPCSSEASGTTPSAGVSVGAIGLGAMPLSTKEHRPSPADAEAVVHAALDAGVTLIDTADAYSARRGGVRAQRVAGRGGAALVRRGTVDVLVATKGGHTRRGHALGARRVAGLPAAGLRGVAAAAATSTRSGSTSSTGPTRRRRGRSRWAALRALFDDGLVRMVGISNADIAQIDAARAILGDALVSVQNQFSPGYRSSADELAHCAAHGLALLPWSPFGGVSAAGSLDADGARLRRGGRRARGVGLPGDAGLAPRAGRRRHPDPGGLPAGVDRRLRRRGRPDAHPRPARPPERPPS